MKKAFLALALTGLGFGVFAAVPSHPKKASAATEVTAKADTTKKKAVKKVTKKHVKSTKPAKAAKKS